MVTQLTTDLHGLVQKYLAGVLQHIAEKYDLDHEELRANYLEGDFQPADSGSGTEKKKRGRKKKQKDEYIEAEEYEYEGVKYLVDGQNNVYTYNVDNPTLVGERLVDGTVRLFQE